MTIIAATDFSPPGAHAALTGARLARKLGDSLVLVRVIEPPVSIYPELGLTSIEVMESALRDANDEAMKKAVADLTAAAPGVAITPLLVPGVPEQVLAELAQERSAGLVVMGTHGRRPAARLLLGSVAERTVLEAPCPVLVLREGATPFDEWLEGRRNLRVMVGIDQGSASEAAIAWVRALRAQAPCDVVLLHEYWPPAEYTRLGLHGPRDLFHTDPEVVAILERELRARLGEWPGQGEVHLRVRAAWGRIGEALASEAENDKADLLVVGTHQPHGWERLRSGSRALGTLHACRIPVVCVPERLRPAAAPPHRASIPTLRSVLCATDLSEPANAAIPQAYALVRGGGVVELCHVYERFLPTPIYSYDAAGQAISPQQRAELELRLKALIPAEAERLGITTHVTVIDGGTPADALVQASRRLLVDAIVVASHGRTGLGKVALGSVAEGILRGADRPVHVVRAPVR
jgi:nucleotide-binding universal stress UspA family protein